MNEVEKMYRNADVKYYKEICAIKNVIDKISNQECYFEVSCTACPLNKTSFTAEKQIELIKWISNNDKDKNKELTLYNSAHPYYYFGLCHKPAHSEDDMCGYGEGLGTTFEDGLASIINNLWQDLTEEERKQIRGILE